MSSEPACAAPVYPGFDKYLLWYLFVCLVIALER